MEMRVESIDGFSLPIGCHVAIRVGEILKQGKYEPQRCYYFPQADRRRNAKVDLYQHVGSCVLAVDPEVKSTHEVNVTSTVASFPGTRLRVFVQGSSPEQQKKQQETKGKEVKSQARAYLAQHCVEERLGEAVKALLKKQPEDPWEFLCQFLQPVVHAPPAQDTARDKSEDIRKKLGDCLLQSLDDGSFEKALSEMHRDKQQQQTASRSKVDEIRSKTCEALVNAAKDGTLQQILKETQRDVGDAAALKARAREVLHSALDSGRLQEALQDVLREEAAKPSGELTAKEKKVLEKSAANGKLDKAKNEMLAKASKAVVNASEEDIIAVVKSLKPEGHRKLESACSLVKAAKSLETASAEEIQAVVNSLSEHSHQRLSSLVAKAELT
eukprot:TRINITY_DN14731_c0_g1_i1.p1 TRINITY_DN14731_c0_g1~~TRINITY_DN14731_c0_g1_i1.p1  ORF type:complete len:396 (+),score=115.89 TRINITY_DN14731_c0_g1_i1:35-1189(+)